MTIIMEHIAMQKPKPSYSADEPSPVLKSKLNEQIDRRNDIDLRISSLNAQKPTVLREQGETAFRKLQADIRDAEERREMAEISMGELQQFIKVAEARESDEKLKADSKQWHIDAKKEFELRDKFFKQALELYGTLSAYREVRQKATWRTVIGRADALGLKPVDEFSELLAQKGNRRPHPVHDDELFIRLKQVEHFNAHLKDLGIQV